MRRFSIYIYIIFPWYFDSASIIFDKIRFESIKVRSIDKSLVYHLRLVSTHLLSRHIMSSYVNSRTSASFFIWKTHMRHKSRIRFASILSADSIFFFGANSWSKLPRRLKVAILAWNGILHCGRKIRE